MSAIIQSLYPTDLQIAEIPLKIEHLQNHKAIQLQYKAHIANIIKSISDNKSRLVVLEQIHDAHLILNLLEKIYQKEYLDVPRELESISKEKNALVSLTDLINNNSTFNTHSVHKKLTIFQRLKSYIVGLFASQRIREGVGFWNYFRLLFSRLRKELLLIAEEFSKNSSFHQIMQHPVLGAIFNWLSALMFVPRILTNLAMLLKHTYLSIVMRDSDILLNWLQRMHLQIKHRWAELINDIPWTIVNIMTAFVYTNPVTIGLLNVFSQVFECTWTAIRYWYERKDILKQQAAYYAQLNQEVDPEKQELIRQEIHALADRITFEEKKLIASFINAVVVCLGFSLLLVAVPYVPIIGAGISVLASLGIYWYNNIKLKRPESKPADNLTNFVEKQKNTPVAKRLSFFQPAEKPVQNSISPAEPSPEVHNYAPA